MVQMPLCNHGVLSSNQKRLREISNPRHTIFWNIGTGCPNVNISYHCFSLGKWLSPKKSFEPNSIHFPNASNTNPKSSIEELVSSLNHRFELYNIPIARFHFDDWWYDHKGTVFYSELPCVIDTIGCRL